MSKLRISTYIGAASLFLIVPISSCDLPAHDPSIMQKEAHTALNYMIPACRDHVQYLVYEAGPYMAVTPRLHTDGVPYEC